MRLCHLLERDIGGCLRGHRLHLKGHCLGPLIVAQCLKVTALLQVTDQHHVPSAGTRTRVIQTVFFQGFGGHDQCPTQHGTVPGGRACLQGLHDQGTSLSGLRVGPGVEPRQKFGMLIKSDHANPIRVVHSVQHVTRPCQRLIPEVFPLHGGTGVHQQHQSSGHQMRLVVRCLAPKRPCKDHGQKTQHQTTQQQQRPLLHPAAVTQARRRRGQKHQRAECHMLARLAPDQMQHNGYTHSSQSRQKERIEKTHWPPL